MPEELKREQGLAALRRVLRHAAMDYLAQREHTVSELQQKIAKRYKAKWQQGSLLADLIDDDLRSEIELALLIDEAIEQLREEGLQSDARFVEAFINSKKNRGHGPQRIRQELKQKGVDGPEVRLAFEACEVDWFALAEQQLQKKFGDAPITDYQDRAKRARFLQYRGFEFAQIDAVLND